MRYSSPRISTSKPGVGREQHPVARLDVAHRRADRDHLGPGEAAVEVGGRRDEDAAAALAVAGLVGRQHEQPVGGHADRLLGVVALGGGGSHVRRLPFGFVDASALRLDSRRVGETSEVAGRNRAARDPARADVAAPQSWTRRALHTALAYFHPHQAAGHRAPARHHGAGDDPGRRRDALARLDRRGAGRWRARGGWRQHHQLLDRARPRPDDAPHRAPAAPPRRRQARRRARVRPRARGAGVRARSGRR